MDGTQTTEVTMDGIQTEDEKVAGDTHGPKKPIQTEDEKMAGDTHGLKKYWVKLHHFLFGPPQSNAAGIAAGPPKRVSAAEEVTLKDISNIASDTMLLSATLESAAKVAGAVSWVHQKGVQEGTTAIVKNILGHDSKEESVNVKMVAESVDILRRHSAMIKDTLAHLDEELLPPRVVVSQPVSADPPKETKVQEETEGPDGGPWEDLLMVALGKTY